MEEQGNLPCLQEFYGAQVQFMLVALALDFDGVCWLLVTSTKTGISSATTSRWPTVGGDVGLFYTPGFPRESALMKEQ